MKKISILFGLLLLVLTMNRPQVKVHADSSNDIDIYLVAGQSNAVGQTVANVEQLTMMDERFSTGFENVLYYGYTDLPVNNQIPSDVRIQNAKLGFGFRTSDSSKVYMGPEAGMAYYLSNARRTNDYGIIKYASGSSSIYDDVTSKNNKAKGNWYSKGVAEAMGVAPSDKNISGYCYDAFMDVVAKGLEAYKQAGFNPIIKGLAWMQGEAECGSEEYSKKYSTLLTALIKDFRTDLTAISDQDLSEMPVIIAKIPSDYLPGKYTSIVREQQQFVDDNDINVKSIDNDGFKTFDGHHYPWNDMLKLGMNFARAFLDDRTGVQNSAKFILTKGGTSKLLSASADAGEIIETSLIPNIGYELSKEDVKFLDLNKKPVEVKYAFLDNFLTFVMPECDVQVEVNFRKIPQYEIDYTYENGDIYRTNPSRNPYRDEKVTFTFIPDSGYEFSSLKINGVSMSSQVDMEGQYPSLTLNVTENMDLEVEFVKKEVQKEETPKDDNPNDLKFKNYTGLYVGLSVGGVVIVGGSIALVVVFKIKKNKGEY
ncbi:MAG: sialate O-acetylesterase [Erysipelotrichaceae bacterium]|nr:sialate O-acetylesterase [Erysipelotrichaceae bacterium]